MNTFKLDPDGFKEIRNKNLATSIPLTILAVSAGIYISLFNHNADSSTIYMLPVLIPIILILIVYSFFRGLKKQKEMWYSYELNIDDETVSRTQKNTPTVIINKNEIKEITETMQGHIIVKSPNRINFIVTPKSIEGKKEVLDTLSQFSQISRQEKRDRSRFDIIVPILTIALMLIFFVSRTSSVIVLTGIALTVTLLWAFIEIQRSKNVDRKTKLGSYLIFLIVVSIIWRFILISNIFSR